MYFNFKLLKTTSNFIFKLEPVKLDQKAQPSSILSATSSKATFCVLTDLYNLFTTLWLRVPNN